MSDHTARLQTIILVRAESLGMALADEREALVSNMAPESLAESSERVERARAALNEAVEHAMAS